MWVRMFCAAADVLMGATVLALRCPVKSAGQRVAQVTRYIAFPGEQGRAVGQDGHVLLLLSARVRHVCTTCACVVCAYG